MNQENTSSSMSTGLLAFLAGAAVGAVVVALTTPKTGAELRVDLKELAGRTKRRAMEMAGDASEKWDDVKERTNLAAGDLRRGITDAANDLRG